MSCRWLDFASLEMFWFFINENIVYKCKQEIYQRRKKNMNLPGTDETQKGLFLMARLQVSVETRKNLKKNKKMLSLLQKSLCQKIIFQKKKNFFWLLTTTELYSLLRACSHTIEIARGSSIHAWQWHQLKGELLFYFTLTHYINPNSKLWKNMIQMKNLSTWPLGRKDIYIFF